MKTTYLTNLGLEHSEMKICVLPRNIEIKKCLWLNSLLKCHFRPMQRVSAISEHAAHLFRNKPYYCLWHAGEFVLTHEARHFLVTFSELKVRQNFEKIFFFKLNFWQRGYCRIVNELSAHIFAVAVSLKLNHSKKL